MKYPIQINKIGFILFFVTAFFAFKSLNAQQPTMSSMGMINNTSSHSNTINFKSTNNCVDVQSGIAALNSVKFYGAFSVNCEVKQTFNKFGLILYPNPLKSFGTIKFSNNPPISEVFSMSIWNAEGELLKTEKEWIFQQYQGKQIDLSTLSPGVYVLILASPLYTEAVKFIKVN
jgi:hypothetical protein